MRVALLAGGTGGAKLAAGMQELISGKLAVIANTADDTYVHGLHVSPDPDLITYWLAGEIDEERGWGIAGDSFTVHERLEQLGSPGWFQLSDRDLATCLYRTHFRAEGGTLTAAQGQIARALGVSAAVLPMCEEPGRLARPSGVPDRRPRRIADPGGGGRRARGSGAHRGGPGGARGRGRSGDRPVEPGDLDRADPRGARHARRDWRLGRAGDRGEPVRRRTGRQGSDRELHGGRWAAIDRQRGRLPLRGGDPGDGGRRRRSRPWAREHSAALVPDADGGL